MCYVHGFSLFAVCVRCVSVSVSLASVPWIATVGSSSSSAGSQKQAQCACVRRKQALYHITRTHRSLPNSPLFPGSSHPSAISSQPSSLPASLKPTDSPPHVCTPTPLDFTTVLSHSRTSVSTSDNAHAAVRRSRTGLNRHSV